MFETHKLNEMGLQKAEFIATQFKRFYESIEHACANSQGLYCDGGREISIFRTKLEEACFYAKRSMALQQENQEHRQPYLSPDITGHAPSR